MKTLIDLIGKLYEFIWKHTTKRPWTYTMRQWTSQHSHQALALIFVAVVGMVVAQVVAVQRLNWWALFLMVPVDFCFLLTGHLYWDTPGAYIPKS